VLSFRRGLDKFALDLETSSDSSLCDLSEVGNRTVNDNLECACAASVSQLNKGKVFAAHASSSCPASNLDYVVEHFFIFGSIERGDSDTMSKRECGHVFLLDNRIANKMADVFALVASVLGTHGNSLDLLCLFDFRICRVFFRFHFSAKIFLLEELSR